MTDAAPDFATLTVSEAEGVVAVTLDHPPVNLLDAAMLGDLARLVGELERSETARVVVMRSADPEFFIAHADLHLIQALPATSARTRPPSSSSTRSWSAGGRCRR
jgi:enoyl-CoA hydratase/carnithine racemase